MCTVAGSLPQVVGAVPCPALTARNSPARDLPRGASTAMRRAAGIGALYIVGHDVLRRTALSLLAAPHKDAGDTPRWRALVTLWPQLVCLPLATAAAAAGHRWSLRAWCDACATRRLSMSELSLIVIFASVMVIDLAYALVYWPLTILRPTMVAHHLVCLAGHAYAVLLGPRSALPCFLCAVTALEMGSALSNCFYMEPTLPIVRSAFLVGMSSSNAASALLTLAWERRAADGGLPRLARWLPLGVSTILIAMRQETVVRQVPPGSVLQW